MSHPIDDEDPTPRAVPGKRPGPTPPKPAAKPVGGVKGAQPQTVVEAQEARLSWGHVGSVTKPGRLSDGTSRPGVIRVVEANIAYHLPPLDPYIWVSASLNYVGQYEMFWTEGDPFDVRSLGDLGAELRGDATKPRLATLDRAADALLSTAERLHAHDGRLGLLHPGNVMIVPKSGGERIVLPDLGFVWRGGHGKFPWKDSPGRPRWLNEDPRENAHARLWDEEPVWKQFSTEDAAAGDRELVPIQSDLRNIARVFSSLLTGRIERDLPTPPNAAATWGVLRAVIKGEITTAEQFRSRLAEHPLSEHWTAPNMVSPPEKSGSLLVLVGCLGLLGLGALGTAAALYFAGVFDGAAAPITNDVAVAPTSRTKPPSGNIVRELASAGQAAANAVLAATPVSTKRQLPKVEVDWKNKPLSAPKEIAELLKLIEGAKDPKQSLEYIHRLYQFYEASDDATRNRIRPWVEYWRGDYVDKWEQRYKAADDSVIKNPALRFEVGKQTKDLHDELSGLRQRYEPISPSLNQRETECLLISELRSRELGSPQ